MAMKVCDESRDVLEPEPEEGDQGGCPAQWRESGCDAGLITSRRIIFTPDTDLKDELKKAVGPRIGYNLTTSLQREAMEVRWVMKMMVCCG